MLSIKLNGNNVVLNSDFSFSISRENPIFNDPETLAGDYIESMTFPIKGNRHIFKNVNRITSRIEVADYDIEIFYNGYHLISGTFTIKSADNDYITGDTKLNALSFFYKIRDLKLTDIPDEEMVILGITQENIKQQINNITNGYYPIYNNNDKKVAFPTMLNNEFYDDSENFDFNGKINQYFHTGSHDFNTFITINGVITIYKHPFVPCFYLLYLIKTIIKSQSYSINFQNNSLLNKLIITTNCSLDDTNNDFQLIADFYTNYQISYFETWRILYVNNIISDESSMIINDTVIQIKETGHYKISFDLTVYNYENNSSWKYTGKLRITTSNSTTDINNNTILHFNKNDVFTLYTYGTVFYPHKGTIKFLNIENNFLLYNGIIKINHFVPEILQITLFSILKNLFNAGFFINESTHTIEMITFNQIISKSPIPLNIKLSNNWSIDKTAKGFTLKYENSYSKEEHPETINFTKTTFSKIPVIAKQGNYAHVINEANIYFYNEDAKENEEKWEHFNIWNQESKIEEDDMITFDIPFSLLNMNQSEHDQLMPQLEGKGISVFNEKVENEEYSILVYHGKQIASDTGLFANKTAPLASITKYDGQGNVIDPDHSLLIEDIEKNYYRSFIHFIRTSREVKFKTKMKIVDFMKLRMQEKYTACGYTFIIKSMKMSVSVNNYSFVEMTIAII